MINRRSKNSSNSARRDRAQANRSRHVFETLEPRMMLTGNLPGDLPIETDPVNSCWSAAEHLAESSPNLNSDAGQRAIVGDYDLSGTVDRADYLVWKNSFGSTVALAADGNQNGIIDLADYTLYADNLESTVRQGPTGVILTDAVDLDKTTNPNDPLRFSISLVNAGTSVAQLNPYQTKSVYNTTGCYDGWQINDHENWRTFYGMETHRFGVDRDQDLSKYTLRVQIEDTQSVSQMWLAGGSIEAPGNYNNQVKAWEFELSNFKAYFSHPDSSAGPVVDQGVRQFTLQPYDANGGSNYHGHRAVVVSFGPQTGYGVSGAATDWQTVYANNLKAPYQKSVTLNDAQGHPVSYDVIVGGFADWLLTNWNGKHVNIIADGEIESSDHLISQSLLYRLSSTQNPWKTTTLNMPKKIAVTGTGTINGYSQFLNSRTLSSPTEFDQFYNALLELQSSYQGKSEDWAIDVAGINFIYPPRRFEGTVTLNTRTAVNWSGSNYTQKLNTAISNSIHGQWQVVNNSPVHAYDNRLIGGWLSASDGFETLAPGSVFERNVFHVNDDAIKVRTKDLIFKDTLVLQGNAGSVINLSGYGITNESVSNSKIYDTYVHRITQPMPQDDDIGGMISNRTIFTPMMKDADGDAGIWNITIQNITVPSFSNHNQEEANSVVDTGIFSALDNSPRGFAPPESYYDNIQNGEQYALQFIEISDVTIKTTTHPKPPMYAFGSFYKSSSPHIKYESFLQTKQQTTNVDYNFYYDVKKNVNVNWGSQNAYESVTLAVAPNALLVTGSDRNDQLFAPSDWLTRLQKTPTMRITPHSERKSPTPCESSSEVQIPAVLFVGQTGQDSYQIEPGMFTTILDHGAPADRDRLTGIPGRAGQWSHFRLGANDYLLVSKHHPKTKVLLVDPLGRQEAGNRIAKLEFGSGESVRVEKFLNRSNRLGAMTYQQAAQRIGLDVGKSLGLSSEDRLFLAGHTGVDPQQIRFLNDRDHHQDPVGPPIANPPRPELPNRICGDAGPNILRGTAEVDYIFGLGDADNLYGGADDDKLFGGKGSDTLFGQAGNDFLAGGHGSDSLIGAKGDDWLYGDEGDDFLRGSQGNDYLSGGRGSDQLNGGEGQDVFLVEKEPGRDVIQDFNLDDDRIVLGDGIQNFSIETRNNDAYLYNGPQELAVVLGAGGKLVQQAHILSGGNESDTLKRYKQLAKDGIDWIVKNPVPPSYPHGIPTPVCPDGTDKCDPIQDRLALIEGATNLKQLNLVAGPSLAMPQYSSGYDGIAPLGTGKYPVCMQFTQSPTGWLGVYGTTKTTRYAFAVMRFSISPDPQAHIADNVFFNVTGAFDDGSGWHPIPQNVGPATYSCDENGVTTFTYSQREDGITAEFHIDENRNMSGTASYEGKSYTFINTPREAPKLEGENGCVPICFGGIGTSYWSYTNMNASMINKRGQLETGTGWFDHQWINTGLPVKPIARWAFLTFPKILGVPPYPSPFQWLWLATQITDGAHPRAGHQYTGAIDIHKDCQPKNGCSVPLQVGDKFQTTMNRFHNDESPDYKVDVTVTILDTIKLKKDGLTQTFPTRYLLAFKDPDFKMVLEAEPSSNRRGSIDNRVPMVTGLMNWEGPGRLYDTDNNLIGQGFLEAMNLMRADDVLSHAFAVNDIQGKVPPPVPYPHDGPILPCKLSELFDWRPKPTNGPPQPPIEDDQSQKPDPLLTETAPDRNSHSRDQSKPPLQPPGAAPQNGHQPGSLRMSLTQKWQRLGNRFRPNGP